MLGSACRLHHPPQDQAQVLHISKVTAYLLCHKGDQVRQHGLQPCMVSRNAGQTRARMGAAAQRPSPSHHSPIPSNTYAALPPQCHSHAAIPGSVAKLAATAWLA